jgi:hypothetical protein
MEGSMWEDTMKIKSKAMEFTLGLMAEDMKEIGKMGREMDQGK